MSTKADQAGPPATAQAGPTPAEISAPALPRAGEATSARLPLASWHRTGPLGLAGIVKVPALFPPMWVPRRRRRLPAG